MPDTGYLFAAAGVAASVTWALRAVPFVALAVTVGVHLWRRSALLSIVGGTVVYVVLVNAVHLR